MKARLKNFTPVLDSLAQEVGLITATVFGLVWRYCQMSDAGTCDRPLATIANRANVSRKTVERHVKKLVKLGYLHDLTPDRTHQAHVYRDTGKARLLMEISLQNDAPAGKTESPASDRGQTESRTEVRQRVAPRSDRESDIDTCTDTCTERTQDPAGHKRFASDPRADKSLPPPANIKEWLQLLQKESNQVGVIMFMYEVLYPDAPKIAYGKLGAFMKRMGGTVQLARYLYEFAGKGLDDPVTYIATVHKNKSKQPAGRSRKEEKHEPTAAQSWQDALKRARAG